MAKFEVEELASTLESIPELPGDRLITFARL